MRHFLAFQNFLLSIKCYNVTVPRNLRECASECVEHTNEISERRDVVVCLIGAPM